MRGCKHVQWEKRGGEGGGDWRRGMEWGKRDEEGRRRETQVKEKLTIRGEREVPRKRG
jgi:hypothetical protein